MEPPTFMDHWKRGALVCFTIGLVGLASLVASALIVGLPYLALELVLPRKLGAKLDEDYMTIAVVIVASIIGPYMLSEAADKKDLVPTFDSLKRKP